MTTNIIKFYPKEEYGILFWNKHKGRFETEVSDLGANEYEAEKDSKGIETWFIENVDTGEICEYKFKRIVWINEDTEDREIGAWIFESIKCATVHELHIIND